MTEAITTTPQGSGAGGHGNLTPPGLHAPGNWYQRIPLPVRIVVALALGALVGYLLQYFGLSRMAGQFKPVSDLVLRLLGALATPLMFLAVLRALMGANVSGRRAALLFGLLMLNTVVAIVIGLAVANVIQPGTWATLTPPEADRPLPRKYDFVEDLLGKIPGSILRPLADNDIMAVILIALALGVALRIVRGRMAFEGRDRMRTVEDLLEVGFRATLVMLHWVFELVPLAVFAVVVRVVGTQGFGPFLALGGFIVAVLVALSLQMIYYLLRLWTSSRFTPWQFLRGGADAFLTAFSTASSAATLPITYACAREKLGVSEESASLGVMVGGTFNHDGTALYEAMAALFVAQLLGMVLGFEDQLLLVLLAVFASVGAAGIPEAGLVTMIAVFSAVSLPVDYIPLLLTVDWFLDRCRTAINVMGDLSVTCLVDGPAVQPAVASP